MDKKKCKIDVEVFHAILQICPRLPNQEFVIPPSIDEEIVSFIKELGYTGDIDSVTKVYINHMHQPWRSFDTAINRCLSGKTTGLDKIRLPSAQILWGMYYNQNVDFVELLWEDFILFMHTVQHDSILGSLRFVFKAEEHQVYGALILAEMTNRKMRNSTTYKTYLSFDTGAATPKKERKFKKPASPSKKKTLVAVEEPHYLRKLIFHDILQICPRLQNQEFVIPPSSDEEIVSFIKELGYTGTTLGTRYVPDRQQRLYDTRENVLSQHDSILGSLRFVSKTKEHQVYGALIPAETTNRKMRNYTTYKTYLAFATCATTPKKARKFKKSASPSKKKTLVVICPRLPNQEFVVPPSSNEEIVSFIKELWYTSDIDSVNKGMYYNQNVDFVELLWKDFMFQIDNKDSKKQEKMYYPRFTKAIIQHFISKDKSISMRNRLFVHTVKHDSILGSLRFVSKTEEHQVYGELFPAEMSNKKMQNSTTYKTYLAFATGAATPKKARKFKKHASSSKKKTLVVVEEPAEKLAKKPAARRQTAGVQIRDTPGVSVSKKKASENTKRSKRIELLIEAALHKEA
ncbi:hypothetical protein Tco_0169444 [Tanacetum coccineum]